MKVIERIPQPERPKKAEPKPRTAAPALGWIGSIVTFIGSVMLLRSRDLCGSVISPDLGMARVFEAYNPRSGVVRECVEKIDAATVPSWMVFCIGIALILVAILVAASSRRQSVTVAAAPPQPPPEPTLSGELEALAGLVERGILTQEEFNTKKAQILTRDL